MATTPALYSTGGGKIVRRAKISWKIKDFFL
jgi:hypothetical protein